MAGFLVGIFPEPQVFHLTLETATMDFVMNSVWPKTLEEAVKICLLALTAQEKSALKNTSQDNLIMFHFGWAMRMRNEFGMWAGNDELIRSCGAFEPDGASTAIVKAACMELNK
jgi:hypothetical protein